MKTTKNYWRGLMLLLLLGVVFNTQAQDRGRGRDKSPGRGHSKENSERGHDKTYSSDRDHNKHRGDDRHYARNNRASRHDYRPSHDRYHYKRYVTYNYHRYRRPVWAPVYGYRYNTRYIYYNDYNVYYDCHRDVFVTWTGRRWIVTNHVPDFMFRVNFTNTVVTGVDYWDDDFDFYLEKRKPVYVNIQAGW